MQFHKVTLLIGDEDVHGDPRDWAWDTLDVAPFIYVLDSEAVTRHETPFDQQLIKEWEAEEAYERQWDETIHQKRPQP